MTDLARFYAKVDRSGDCWQWSGCVMANGYGRFADGLAHRWAYERFIGPIPPGHQIDHLCHKPDECRLGDRCPHRRCVNPAHLEAVTPRENTLRSGSPSAIHARKTRCPAGHPYDDANTHTDRGGMRHCRACDRERHAARRFAKVG